MNLNRLAAAGLLTLGICTTGLLAQNWSNSKKSNGKQEFRRVATFPVIRNLCPAGSPNSCFDKLAFSEIVASSEDGRTLIYTDAGNKLVGFLDISDPANPVAKGTLQLTGEPTSVAVVGNFALVAVNTSPSYVAPNGHLTVIDMTTRTIVPAAAALPLGGQPDSVAISPDKKYAAVVIENERDEDVNGGAIPQLPGGKLVRVTLSPLNNPAAWTLTDISLVDVADLYPADPEPEYVDINENNIAVVSLQENNHIALVDLKTAQVIQDFSAGTVNLRKIDAVEDDVIDFNSSLRNIPREPDTVAWISSNAFATADEGDLNGGSRGFTIFNRSGKAIFESGSEFEYLGASIGHYPESRSENKGTEPEALTFAKFDYEDYLFVGSERGSFIGVYKVRNQVPELAQVLPTGVAPEGIKAIPQRNLLVVATEEDGADGDVSDRTIRASIVIYQRMYDGSNYPTIISDDEQGVPIPWAALSGLAAHPTNPYLAYSVSDSYYGKGFIYPMDLGESPARITKRIEVTGAGALDLEGVAVRSNGSLWLATEGNAGGSLANRILAANQNTGAVTQIVNLPASVHARRTGNGFEGVAVTGSAGVNEKVYVAFQREWSGDPARKVRIGVYDVAAATWGFLYYPLEAVASPNGGWVGLSEITSLGNGNFAVIERDNQAGDDARIKRIYRFSVNGLTPQPDCTGACDFPTVVKRLARDLMPDLRKPGGAVIEKVEGLAFSPASRHTYIHTDNDGVDGSNGETQMIDLGGGVLP